MIRIRRNWKQMSPSAKESFARDILDKVKDSSIVLPDSPPFIALKTKNDALRAGLDELSALETKVKSIRNRVHELDDEMADVLNVAASYTEGVTEGAASEVLRVGFELLGASTRTAVPMTRVLNLVLSGGDHEGTINAAWDPVPSARLYELQTSPTAEDGANWAAYEIPQSRSFILLNGLASGRKVWVRVRALGAGDQPAGEWSDPGVQMAS